MSKNTGLLLAMCLWATATGCHAIDFYTPSRPSRVPSELEPPRELSMVSLPSYRIAPPDVVRIEVVKLVPRPTYRIGCFDMLQIRVLGTLPEWPIDEYYYLVETDGIVTFAPPYGAVRVVGLTVPEAEAEITRALGLLLQSPQVSVQLYRSADVQQLTGSYAVGPDGAIRLKNCGPVYLAGKTATEARKAVEQRLIQYFDSPRVGVEVVGYNSQGYYVINVQGLIFGSTVQAMGLETRTCPVCGNIVPNGSQPGQTCRFCGTVWPEGSIITRRGNEFPITGNETVLDAVSRATGSGGVGNPSTKVMWIARPAPSNPGQEQILPIDWQAITQGVTDTNYQLLPGDRLFLVDDSLVTANLFLNNLLNPIERLLGITQLGSETIRASQVLGRSYNSTRNN